MRVLTIEGRLAVAEGPGPAMQVTMENAFDLAKYLVVLVFNKPDQYKWTAMISLVAVMVAVSRPSESPS
jgi:hypothetical protein